jgi:HK97 family phage portal protein
MKLLGYEINKVGKAQTPVPNDVMNKLNQALSKFGLVSFFSDNTENFVKKAYQYNNLVFSVINRKAVMAAQIPWVLYEVVNENAAKAYANTSLHTKATNPMAAMKLKAKAFKETSHPVLSRILERPNQQQGWHEWFIGISSYKDITGNAFIYGLSLETGKDKGKPQELFALPSQKVVIVGGGYMQPIKGYKLTLNFEVTFNPEEICHVKNFNPDYSSEGSWMYGMSPLRAGARSVQSSNDNITASAKMYQNIGAMGILSDESVEDANFSSEQAINIKSKYKELYGGSEALNDIIVTAGKWKWQHFGLSPVDLAILDARKSDLRDICNLYRMQSQLFNDVDITVTTGINEARKSCYTDSILPDLDHVKDQLNPWLCGAWSDGNKRYYTEPDITQIIELQSDFKTQVDALKEAYWITYNEKRAFQNYEPINKENMDIPLVPAGMAPITDLSISNDIGL